MSGLGLVLAVVGSVVLFAWSESLPKDKGRDFCWLAGVIFGAAVALWLHKHLS